jgi:hypothetical protein
MIGMSANAASRPIPTSPKNGSHASLVMIPNAPCPMKQNAAPMRSVHQSARVTSMASSPVHEFLGEGSPDASRRW